MPRPLPTGGTPDIELSIGSHLAPAPTPCPLPYSLSLLPLPAPIPNPCPHPYSLPPPLLLAEGGEDSRCFITHLYRSRPRSRAFIFPHSPFSKASFAAATALSTSLTWARDTWQMTCGRNRDVTVSPGSLPHPEATQRQGPHHVGWH